MKKIFLLLFTVAAISLGAEEIHMKDGTVQHGLVTGSDEKTIIFRDEKTFHAVSVSRNLVDRILFTDGISINPNEIDYDEISTKQGKVIKGKALSLTPETVIFQGAGDVLPRRIPAGDVKKITYRDGKVITLWETPGDKERIRKTGGPPTHHADGKMNFFLIAGVGFGAARNPDLVDFNTEHGQRYLDYLQANYDFWDDNKVGKSDVPQMPIIDLVLEGRMFLDSGAGIGITGGVLAMLISSTNLLTPESDSTVELDPMGAVVYLASTLYYKHYIGFRNEWAFYLLGGAGLGFYRASYSLSLSEGTDGNGLPGRKDFEKEYAGSGTGFHGIIEAGIEKSFYCFFGGIRARYCSIDELTSGGDTMRLNSGRTVKMNLTGAELYAGIGVFF